MTERLHAVVVSYKRLPLLRQCVESFVRTTTCAYSLRIVDNGSPPDVVTWIVRESARLGYLYTLLAENHYPGYAANVGWEVAPADATLLMRSDNDSLWLPGWSDDMLEAFTDPDVGQYGPVAEGDEPWTSKPDWPVGGNTVIRRELFTDWMVRYDETPWPVAAMQEDQKLYCDIRDRGWKRAWGKQPGLIFAGMRDAEYDAEVAQARSHVR